jgi:putative SOS response-associated peptidase YedK
MCVRYVLWGIDDLGGRFLIVDPSLGFRSHFNIAPGTENPVVIREQDGNHVRAMQWGLALHGAKDAASIRPINARAESLPDRPMFKGLLDHNRCIVPANGFYEWKKAGGRKEPYFIHLRDKALFGFAGLCDTWQGPAGKAVMTYTIITTEPNELISPIHNRMPAILTREHEQQWLACARPGDKELKAMLAPYAAEEMAAYPVSSDVNAAMSESEELIRPRTIPKSWFG